MTCRLGIFQYTRPIFSTFAVKTQWFFLGMWHQSPMAEITQNWQKEEMCWISIAKMLTGGVNTFFTEDLSGNSLDCPFFMFFHFQKNEGDGCQYPLPEQDSMRPCKVNYMSLKFFFSVLHLDRHWLYYLFRVQNVFLLLVS